MKSIREFAKTTTGKVVCVGLLLLVLDLALGWLIWHLAEQLAIAQLIVEFFGFAVAVLEVRKVLEAQAKKPKLRWGLNIPGLGLDYGDGCDFEDGMPTRIHCTPPKRGQKRIWFHFYVANDGSAPSTSLEARFVFNPSPLWDQIRDRAYAESTLQMADRWSVDIYGAYVFWRFYGGDMQLLPGRHVSLGPFVAVIDQSHGLEATIECEVLSAEEEPKRYCPHIEVRSA